MKAIFFLLFLSQNPLLIDDSFKQANLVSSITFYRDSVRHNFDDVKQIYDLGEFKPVGTTDIAFSPGPYYYYLHYSVKNTSDKPIEMYCEVRNPHLNRVQLYYSQGDAYKNSVQTGDYFPFDRREVVHRFFVFKTSLEPGETKSCFLFADKFNESIKIPITLFSKDTFIQSSINESSVLGYYFGAIMIILLASIIISIISPRKLNFLFIIYLLGFSLFTLSHTGFGFKLLWGSYPLFNSLSRSFFAMIANVSILIFSFYFFEMLGDNRWIKTTHWVITSIITLNWIFHFVYYTLIFYNSPLQYLINYKILQSIVFIFPLYMVVLTIYQIIRKNRAKDYLFLLSILGMLVAVSIMMLGQIGLLKDHFVLENITLAALIVDFLVLSGILSFDLYNIKLRNQLLITSLDQAIADGAKNFLKGQQKERSRLAQEIHDGTSVQLSAIQMRLSAIETENNSKRDAILNDLSIISKDLRKFSHNLSSVVLEHFGLINAVEELILSLEDIYPHIEFNFDYTKLGKLNHHLEKEIYFIISELINNSLKHSKGSQINVEINVADTVLLIDYSDNGVGINSTSDSKGFGLKSIEWRLKILNGKLSYEKSDVQNTFHLKIPTYA